MSEPSSGPPAWAPAYVGSAARHGTAGADELLDGSVWRAFTEALGRAAGPILAADPADAPSGYQQLLILLALGIDEALRQGDPHEPHITVGAVDAVLKWGMDCPDALYAGTAIRSDTTYRISGHRGSARYVGFQVMRGMETLLNVIADDLDVAADGTFTWTLEPPDGASTLVVRQFFYDWNAEQPATLHIECADPKPAATHDASIQESAPGESAQAMARRITALGEFVAAGLQFWQDIEAAGRAQGLNTFREPANRTDIGGAAENVTVWGSYDLGPGEALLIEVQPPPALYWSVALGDAWWSSVDYANHQSSLNGHQAELDPDGVFRAVVANDDPGIANWLDPAGCAHGPMIFRWLRADSAPVPATKVVSAGEITALLPHARRVTPDERRNTIARRRNAVRRRFRR